MGNGKLGNGKLVGRKIFRTKKQIKKLSGNFGYMGEVTPVTDVLNVS